RGDAEAIRRSAEVFEELGLKVRFGDSLNRSHGYLAGTDAERAAELNAMFADPGIQAIMTGLITVHGPMMICLGDKDVHPLTRQSFAQLVRPEPFRYTGDITPLHILVEGKAKGPLVGGNLTLLTSTLGTPYEIDTRGCLLFIEDIGEEPYRIDRMLNQLRMAGKLEQAAGILVGDFRDCEPVKRPVSFTLVEVIQHYVTEAGRPSLMGFGIGHGSHNVAVPHGMEAELSTADKKTALRTVHQAESIVVKMTADDGKVGWGEAPATVVITGDSLEAIQSAIEQTFKPLLIGQSLLAYEQILQSLHQAMVGCTSAKAAIDMAVYDLVAQHGRMPLYQFLGGYRDRIETDFTVSVNSPEEMGEDAVQYVQAGFTVLKIKVGKDDIEHDIRRIREIRQRIGSDVKIRLDANQGWQAKEAIRSIRKMEDMGLNIELVTAAVDTLIMADESVFSPVQALEVLQRHAADLINIKLMKAGGIYKAQLINQLAEEYGVECM
ncbi:hypothetical protein BGX30_007289, partial [Mortierella sp. GBA39]